MNMFLSDYITLCYLIISYSAITMCYSNLVKIQQNVNNASHIASAVVFEV